MQTAIHPKYNTKATAKCVCGATFIFGSTVAEIATEICSACHPFYTGKQKLVDTAGKVDKFRAKMAKASSAAAEKADKKPKVSDSIKAAAATKAVRKSSAVDSKKLIAKVKASREKQELVKAAGEGKVATEKAEK